MEILTSEESALVKTLPRPPIRIAVPSTNVWIVEWLAKDEERTGKLLHEWMAERRPGWSRLDTSQGKTDVLASIKRATERARKDAMIPILHIEAHGNDDCLEGPSQRGGRERLSWGELTASLRALNEATKCNLMVVIAACTGFAGIRAFGEGPIAPAVAIVGPSGPLAPSELLAGTKEFYRRLWDQDASLTEMAASASRELRATSFEPEPLVLLFYESFVEMLILRMRTNIDLLSVPMVAQQLWDRMFMIDQIPGNRERCGLDVHRLVAMLKVWRDAH